MINDDRNRAASSRDCQKRGLATIRRTGRPGLLVSVRSATEATVALHGGADWIDLKEPSRGPLGTPDPDVVSAVVDVVDARRPVSLAAGELMELNLGAEKSQTPTAGVGFVKLGLAGCLTCVDWEQRWIAARRHFAPARMIAVAYADWRHAQAPPPSDVFEWALSTGCPALLVDTYGKTGGNLLDHWPHVALAEFSHRVCDAGLALALAGSISPQLLPEIVPLRPSLVAFRGAVCEGGRHGSVSGQRVAAIRGILDELIYESRLPASLSDM